MGNGLLVTVRQRGAFKKDRYCNRNGIMILTLGALLWDTILMITFERITV
jgi:hypothetical protein